jgi:hypothetical protein
MMAAQTVLIKQLLTRRREVREEKQPVKGNTQTTCQVNVGFALMICFTLPFRVFRGSNCRL